MSLRLRCEAGVTTTSLQRIVDKSKVVNRDVYTTNMQIKYKMMPTRVGEYPCAVDRCTLILTAGAFEGDWCNYAGPSVNVEQEPYRSIYIAIYSDIQ